MTSLWYSGYEFLTPAPAWARLWHSPAVISSSFWFFFYLFLKINFRIAILHGIFPHTLPSHLILNARKMLEGKIGFFLKTFPLFFVLLMLRLHLGGSLVKFFVPFNSKTSQQFDSWTTAMFPNVSPSSSRCMKHLLHGLFQMPTQCSPSISFAPHHPPTIPATKTAQQSGRTPINQQSLGPVRWKRWAN